MNCNEIKGTLANELNRSLKAGLFRGEIKFNESMSVHTSLRIGGSADVIVFPEDPLSLKNVLITALKEQTMVFVFGSGTNLLVKDGGIEGLSVCLRAFKNIRCIQNSGKGVLDLSAPEPDSSVVSLFVEAGVPMSKLLSFAGENGYAGLEALAGIPGSFGGAVYTNAGSFGSEIKDVIVSAAFMNMEGKIVIMGKDALNFSYRNSNIPEDAIILSANITLRKDNPEDVSKRIRGFLGRKRIAQPIGEPSAGCVFRNPDGDFAGRLIDAAGCKGISVGDIEVSAVHANFFINKGRASASDFLELMELVRAKVKDDSGITLKPEIKIVGKDNAKK